MGGWVPHRDTTCHEQPAVGGTIPAVNPQVAFATKMNATNIVPSFITSKGPVREARCVKNPGGTRDGGVHDLCTIAGQPDSATELARGNVIFRIRPPTLGAGLIEQSPDSVVLANQTSPTGTR